MKIITICNSKGGVGKTTTTLSIGAILQDKGYRVLYIDADAQANLTESLGGNTNTKTLYNLYDNYRLDIRDTIQVLNNGVHLIGANERLDTINLSNRKDFNNYLKDRLSHLYKDYDYILIDTPPHLNYLYTNALYSSDYAIITGKADIFSLRGINRTLSNLKESNMSVKVLGVLLVQYNKRSSLDNAIKDNLKALTKEYNTKVFNTYIRQCKTLSVIQLLKEPITKYRSTNGYNDYLRLVNEILKDIK